MLSVAAFDNYLLTHSALDHFYNFNEVLQSSVCRHVMYVICSLV